MRERVEALLKLSIHNPMLDVAYSILDTRLAFIIAWDRFPGIWTVLKLPKMIGNLVPVYTMYYKFPDS